MIVLDASAAIELLLWSRAGERVARRISDPDETLHAPHLLDLEVAQVLRRAERGKLVTSTRAAEALAALGELDIVRYAHDALITRIWALRGNCTAYDGAYLALAEALDAPLLTFDLKLGDVPGSCARIEVV